MSYVKKIPEKMSTGHLVFGTKSARICESPAFFDGFMLLTSIQLMKFRQISQRIGSSTRFLANFSVKSRNFVF